MITRRSAAAFGGLGAGVFLLACGGGDGSSDGPTGPNRARATMEVEVISGGTDVDLDGFRLDVDGQPLAHRLRDTLVTVEVEPGDRELLLADVAGNCVLETANPLVVTASADRVARAAFGVRCRELPSLRGEIVTAVFTIAGNFNDEVQRGLFVVDRADGSLRTLTTTPTGIRDNQPAVSPDGKRIAVSRDRNHLGEGPPDVRVHLVHADGTEEPGSIFEGMEWGSMPTWSPDGTRLAFSGAMPRETGRSIYLIDADRSALTRLTVNDCFDLGPAWSPDGEWIAYTSCELGSGIHAVRPNGSGVRRLTFPESGDDFLPIWSPDGSRLAFTSNRTGGWRVYVMDATGGAPRQVTPMSAEYQDFVQGWSADGKRLLIKRRELEGVFVSDVELWLIRTDGSDFRRLTDNEGFDEHASDWAH